MLDNKINIKVLLEYLGYDFIINILLVYVFVLVLEKLGFLKLRIV